MISSATRWAGAVAYQLTGQVPRNRQALYGGAAGLRIVNFHAAVVPPARVERIVAWCRERIGLATPADADAVAAGFWPHGGRDRVLVTFDDGLDADHEVACRLASTGVQALFFVVPSLVGRSLEDYREYHAARGVTAFHQLGTATARGLSVSQVREMCAMGHRIGAHNFAHRNLGELREPRELAYEIDRALDGVAELTGARCEDFAWAFGQPEHLSDEAAAWLEARVPRVYACHRGLNVPGRTPRFLLRDTVEPDHPWRFTRLCLLGGVDHRLAAQARRMSSRVGLLPSEPSVPAPARSAR